MRKLAEETQQGDANVKRKALEQLNPGFGYGGKFGVEKDRMDKSAVGSEYMSPLQSHQSQKDYKVGFGGSFGVQKDRVDKVSFSFKYEIAMMSRETEFNQGMHFQ